MRREYHISLLFIMAIFSNFIEEQIKKIHQNRLMISRTNNKLNIFKGLNLLEYRKIKDSVSHNFLWRIPKNVRP